jgi:hypothetical protein
VEQPPYQPSIPTLCTRQSQSNHSQQYWDALADPGSSSQLSRQSPTENTSNERTEATNPENNPRGVTPSPVCLLTHSPQQDHATLSTVGEPISTPSPTPAPARPAPGSTPLFSPGLPSNSAKTSKETPVTRNRGTTVARLWIPYELDPYQFCFVAKMKRKNTHKHDPHLIAYIFSPFLRPVRREGIALPCPIFQKRRVRIPVVFLSPPRTPISTKESSPCAKIPD